MLKILVMSCLAVLVVGCNASSTVGNEVDRPTACPAGDAQCAATAKWVIISSNRPFLNKNVIQDQNGAVLYNACNSSEQGRGVLSNNNTVLTIQGMPSPQGAGVSFQVIWRPIDCSGPGQVFFNMQTVRYTESADRKIVTFDLASP